MTRAAHHRIRADSRPRGRAAEVAGYIRDAGADGIGRRELELALGVKHGSIEGVLATVTPRYPQVAEDDDGRLCWVEWGDEA